MALPNDSILVTPGSGATVATHLISAKEYQVMMQADADGHIQGSAPSYLLYQTPRVLTAAAVDFFDLFNATGSGKIIRIRGLWPVITNTAATTFINSWDFNVMRTSAIGTGGTAHTFEGAAAPAAGLNNISRLQTTDPTLSASITSRATPTGGATASHFLFNIPLMIEENNPAQLLCQGVNWMPQLPYNPPFELQENQGIKVRQITPTVSTGAAIGWLLAFAVIP